MGSVFSLSMISPSARMYLLHMRGAGSDCLRVFSLGMVMESIFFLRDLLEVPLLQGGVLCCFSAVVCRDWEFDMDVSSKKKSQ